MLLITVYTMVILGGSGSQAGVVLGALIISPLLEVLRDPGKSRVLFFVVLVGRARAASARRTGGSRSSVRRRSSSASCVHAIARAIDATWVAGQPGVGGFARFFDALGRRAGASGALDRAGRRTSA